VQAREQGAKSRGQRVEGRERKAERVRGNCKLRIEEDGVEEIRATCSSGADFQLAAELCAEQLAAERQTETRTRDVDGEPPSWSWFCLFLSALATDRRSLAAL